MKAPVVVALLTTEGTNTVKTVTDALTTSLSSAGTDLLGVVSSVVPVVIPVMIAVTAIGIGLKIFKKVAGR